MDLVPHLFRTEYSKIVAVLVKLFGFDHVDVAEDIASETFLSALEVWPYRGVPDNPSAWLYAVAKNKAKNQLARAAKTTKAVVEVAAEDGELDLSEENIKDSQLRMIFAVCHPAISPEAQIGLALRILCGFGIEEIADAFLTNKETINKRLHRAKETLRKEKIRAELPPDTEIDQRLDAVLATLYLLFNEGYYSESDDAVLREDLCQEAIRLTRTLLEYEPTCKPKVMALLALMCFHASRFPARRTNAGEIVLYQDQDESLWDQELIAQAAELLRAASTGNQLSKYHVEASIAYWHSVKEDTQEKWESILQLYNQLLMIEYSPVAALNRTFALAKVKGDAVAIVEGEKLKMETNHYYFVLLAELYRCLDPSKARGSLEKALQLAKTQTDKNTIQRKINDLSGL